MKGNTEYQIPIMGNTLHRWNGKGRRGMEREGGAIPAVHSVYWNSRSVLVPQRNV